MIPNYSPLWEWMKARELARIHHDQNHTFYEDQNPIISKYRFCNVRREDDRGTIWIRENIREQFSGHKLLWLMLCISRQINWPDTLDALIHGADTWCSDIFFSPDKMTKLLNDRKEQGCKIYTGAYMISAPRTKGADKQSYISEIVCGDLWNRSDEIISYLSENPTLEGTHRLLKMSNGWGNFMSYQAVVDMRFTDILSQASDVNSWCAAGPGTIRGLNRIYDRPLKFALSQEQALIEIREIYKLAFVITGIEIDFSDVPNILCETDKYLRVKNNEGKPRAKYVPGRGF